MFLVKQGTECARICTVNTSQNTIGSYCQRSLDNVLPHKMDVDKIKERKLPHLTLGPAATKQSCKIRNHNF